MPEKNFINWVNSTLSALSINAEPFFSQLWQKKRLSYDGDNRLIDSIDENSARLICTALDKRQLLLNVLPDEEIHRGPLMFGTALLRYGLDCIRNQTEDATILYYGTSAGFKNSLSYTSVNGTYLDSVFPSAQMSGKYKKGHNRSDTHSEYLPKVICVYHPTSPEHFIQIYKPKWVVVDCGKEGEIDWLDSLISYCKKKYVPIVGWGQNNFSNAITTFTSQGGKIYYSPKRRLNNGQTSYGELILNSEQYLTEL